MNNFIKINEQSISSFNFKEKNILDKLIKEAKKSDMYYKHSACILDGNELISIGHNYMPNTNFNNIYSIHAEISALMRVPKNIKNRKNKEKLKIIIIRLSRTDDTELLMSKPCEKCSNAIKKHNIQIVYYSNNI